MKRCILIAWLSLEIAGEIAYTIKIGLRGGESYSMPIRSKALYRRLQKDFTPYWNKVNYNLALQIATRVLEWNDIFFDEIEIL